MALEQRPGVRARPAVTSHLQPTARTPRHAPRRAATRRRHRHLPTRTHPSLAARQLGPDAFLDGMCERKGIRKPDYFDKWVNIAVLLRYARSARVK